MASIITADQMAATTKRHFDLGKITEQVYDYNILWDRLKKSNQIVIKGGTKIQHPIRGLEQGDTAAIDPDSTRVTATYVTRTYLELDWKYIKNDIAMTLEERVQNQGEAVIVDLMADKYKECMQDVSKFMSTQFYQADASRSANEMNGFYNMCAASASAYAGIDQDDVTEWNAGLYDTSTTTLALYGTGSLEAGMRACTFREGPNLMVTTRALAGIYASKLQPGERRAPGEGSAGATDLYFQSVPIVADPQCNAGDWLFLSTNDIIMFVNPMGNFDVSPWEEDPDHYKFLRQLVMFIGNFAFLRRKTFGAYTAITS